MSNPEHHVSVTVDLETVRHHGVVAITRNLFSAFWIEIRVAGVILAGRRRYGWSVFFIVSGAALGLIVHACLLLGLKYEVGVAVFLWSLDVFRLDKDRSLFEFFEYILLCLTAFATWRAAAAQRSSLLRFIAFLYLYLLADNAMRIHETVGLLLPFRQSYAELAYFMATGLAMFCLLIVGFVADRGKLTAIALVNGAGFALLAFFAVVTDFLHAIFASMSQTFNYVLAFIEDGGEMLTITLIALYSLSILMRIPPMSENT